MDNSGFAGDDRPKRPPVVPAEPLGAPSRREVVHNPGDDGSGAVRRTDRGLEPGLRGADLAREALRAAREAATERRTKQDAEQRQIIRRPAGAARRRRWSGPGPDDRDPQLFGRLVSRLAIERGWSSRLTDATVFARWPDLVGAEMADHCTPVSLRDGELVLQAESTAWATQLRTLQRQLLARLAAAVGEDVVRRIRVVGPGGPTWRHGPRHVHGRGPRDTYG